MLMQRGLVILGLLSLAFLTSNCDESGLPGTSECPPGTLGPYKCEGPDCGPLRAGCLFNQEGAAYKFVSCSLAPLVEVDDPTCNDMKMNGAETYTDCGGDCPVGCTNTRPCIQNSDCESGCCNSEEVCEADNDADGMCNSEDDEPDVPREPEEEPVP
jgi:hypothetical protein